jgi:hypothetical protein
MEWKHGRKRVSALRRPHRNLSHVPRAPPAPLLGEHEGRLRAARAHSPGAAADGSGRRASRKAPFETPACTREAPEKSLLAAMPLDSSPSSTASAKPVLTRKSAMSSAPTRHAGKAAATRTARSATSAHVRVGTFRNCFPRPRGPAAFTKTLSAAAPAAAAAAAAAAAEWGASGGAAEGAAEEGPAPASLAAAAAEAAAVAMAAARTARREGPSASRVADHDHSGTLKGGGGEA